MRQLLLVCVAFLSALWMLVIMPVGGQVDPALAQGHFLCGPQYSGLQSWFSGCNPYSVLWYALDPGYWTQLPYHLFLLGAVSLMFVLYYRMNRRGVVPDWVLIGWLFTNVCWFTFHSESDVMVTLFAPLALCVWQVGLMVPLLKLPWGWSWPDQTQNAHYLCGFDKSYPYQWCSGFNRFGLGGGLVYTYAALGFWMTLPIWVWLARWFKGGKAKELFLTIARKILEAISV